MIDEGTLRERFPEIPWDQPVKLTIVLSGGSVERWACRYCVALQGMKAEIELHQTSPRSSYLLRQQALDHIEAVHHD